ncbi:MAG TPA: acyl-CoA desaturase, partial [Burkholderiaceae bacterium]|nr:acyl-CoA desaturase [Burkholderiaceae bacterium]
WHNNHHHYAASARQGFYWWEVDLTYYGLKLLQALRIVWDVREVPAAARDAHARARGARA